MVGGTLNCGILSWALLSDSLKVMTDSLVVEFLVRLQLVLRMHICVLASTKEAAELPFVPDSNHDEHDDEGRQQDGRCCNEGDVWSWSRNAFGGVVCCRSRLKQEFRLSLLVLIATLTFKGQLRFSHRAFVVGDRHQPDLDRPSRLFRSKGVERLHRLAQVEPEKIKFR